MRKADIVDKVMFILCVIIAVAGFSAFVWMTTLGYIIQGLSCLLSGVACVFNCLSIWTRNS